MNKQELVDDFNKCKKDPIYFISEYVKVTHPTRGLVPFKLYKFQHEILKCLENHRFNVLRKFRQAGCTTISAAYALWFALFQSHKSIVFLSVGDTESTEILDRVKIMYDELPSYLKLKIAEDNKHTLKFVNGSIIRSRPSGKQSGRSLAGSMLIIDEAAFIENIDSIWAAVYPIISTGGRAFILSTVNGVGNWYHELYKDAKEEGNSFNVIDIKWTDHPEYKRQEGYEWLYEKLEKLGIDVDNWEETTRSNLPHKKWLQEYECEFLGTGDTYIEGGLLKHILDNIDENYDIKYNNKMRVWKEPESAYEYVIGVDVSLGRGRDHSAFHIINAYTGEQVAEFYSNKTPINEFSDILYKEGNYYNNALMVVERNTIGENLIDWLFNIHEYENVWMDDNAMLGYQITSKNREVLLAKLEEVIRNNYININSRRTVEELLTFIVTNTGRIEADKGKHDDLTMSLALTIFALSKISNHEILEHSQIPHKERKPLLPTSNNEAYLRSYGGMSKEDIKWLMK
jgi:hypothetical protein